MKVNFREDGIDLDDAQLEAAELGGVRRKRALAGNLLDMREALKNIACSTCPNPTTSITIDLETIGGALASTKALPLAQQNLCCEELATNIDAILINLKGGN